MRLRAMSLQHPIEDLGERIEQVTGMDPASTGRHERKEIVKEAIREELKRWLDERVRDFAWWSLRRLLLLGFVALIYFILTHSGWKQS